jgi:holin-like protein
MIQGIVLLLGFQLAGEFIRRLAHLPIPGPIIGLVLLFAFLRARALIDPGMAEDFDGAAVTQVATPLLRNLAILFVPSGVGVLEFTELFAQHAAAVVFVLVTSTLATMAATALAFVGAQMFAKWLREQRSTYKHALLRHRRPNESPVVSSESIKG